MTTTTDPTVGINRDLTEILNLSEALSDQAIEHARDRLMPGGLAMVSIAPVGSPEKYDLRVDAHERRATYLAETFDLDRDDVLPELYDDEWEPPLQTLRYWAERWRGVRDDENPVTATIETEVRFVRWCVTHGWAQEHEPQFARAAEEINDARRRLESILYAGNRPERTRVRCDRDTCEKNPELIRVHEPRRMAFICDTCETETHDGVICSRWYRCGNIRQMTKRWHSDPANDRWKCTSCKTRFDHDQYLAAHAKQLRSEGSNKFVILGDAVDTLKTQGRARRTVEKWLEPAQHTADRCTICNVEQPPAEYAACPEHVFDEANQKLYGDDGEPVECGGDLQPVWSRDFNDLVEGYCELGTRRRWVWWPDLWTKHNKTRTRRKKAAA